MISQDRLEKALTYLSESDLDSAELETEMKRMEFRAKAVKDAVFLHSTGTVAEREAKAGASEEYLSATNDYLAAVEAFKAVQNKRHTEEIVIDVYRTLEASRRKA